MAIASGIVKGIALQGEVADFYGGAGHVGYGSGLFN